MKNEKIRKIYKTIMLIIIVALVTFIVTSAFLYKKLGKTSKYTITTNISGINSELIKKINTVKTLLNKKYISETEEKDLIEGAIKGYVEGVGDEYTEYFTKEEMEEFMTETEGNYVGIGIYMVQNISDNTVVILSPIKNSPAEKAGLLPGDIISKVDGAEYTGEDFEKISTYIKGKPGTKVKLTIIRDEKELEFEVERQKIDLYPIESEILENDIGYINISSFDMEAGKKFKEAYNNLNKNNKLKGLIIDLRNNGGGVVDEAIEIADYMLEKDEIIFTTKDKSQNQTIEKSTKNPIIKMPIVVITNGHTASASEILAAALKENDKATIVGETTYGKGVIQELISLTDGSGIKITTEEYFTAKGNKINGIGITPDKEVKLPKEVESSYNLEKKDDTQLKEAIKILKNK